MPPQVGALNSRARELSPSRPSVGPGSANPQPPRQRRPPQPAGPYADHRVVIGAPDVDSKRTIVESPG